MNRLTDLRFDFATELSTANRKMHTVFDGLVKKHGLTLSRTRVLIHLSRNSVVNQTELASLLDIQTPTVVRLLDRLEEQGLIARNAVDGDRRAKQITLTDAAAGQVDEIDKIVGSLRDTMLRDIRKSDLEIAVQVLRQVTRNLESPS